MNKKYTLITSLFLLAMYQSVHAQQRLALTDLFAIAEEQSQTLHISKLAIDKAEESIREAKSHRLTDITTDLSVGYLADGVLSDRKLSHWTHVDNPHFTNTFTIKAQQVIYSGGALTAAIHIAETQKKMADLNLTVNRQEVRFAITGFFLDICRLENQEKVVQDNLALSDSLIVQTASRVHAGTALPTDLTRQELHHENLLLQHKQIQDAITIIRHQLSTTLHRNLDNTQFMLDTTRINALYIHDEHPWQQTAAHTNARLQQAATAVTIQHHILKTKHAEMFPKVAIIAENHFEGPITFEVPTINKNINYWFAGIGIQYALSSLWKGKKTIQQARFDLLSSRETLTLAQEEVNNAVQATCTNLATCQAQYVTHTKNLQLAQEHYSVIANRYTNGLCLLTDLLDAANTKQSAEFAIVDAHINIMYNYYKLQYLTSNL